MVTGTDAATADEGVTSGRSGRSVGLTLLAGAVAVLVLLPLTWLFIASNRIGFASGLEIVTQPRTIQVVVNSIVMMTAVTAISILIGVPLAYLTVRTDLPLRRPLTVLLALPLVVPSYIGAITFVSAFGPRGEFQELLAPLGVEQLPSIYGLTGTVMIITLYTYPYVFLTTRAALKSIDTTLFDAARTLRHDRWEAFKRVTVPQIKPAVAAGALLVALYALSDFGTPQIMRYDVFTRVIYVEFHSFGNGPDMAALLSLKLVVLTVFILAIESRVRGGDNIGTEGGYVGGSDPSLHLGKWRWPAALACLALPALSLAVPVGILRMWLVRGTGTGAYNIDLVSMSLNSVGVSGAAALLATLFALPVAYVAAHRSSRLTSVVEQATYVGYAVPGVVIGLALVFLGAQYGGVLYRQGLLAFPLLIFAYVVRFIPQAVGSTRAGFLQVSRSLPEAARTLGQSPGQAFRSVTLPLVAPSLLAGAALVFLTTMKELPATLLLRPPGFNTLVTAVWRAERSAEFGLAAIPAIVLLVVSGLSMFVLLKVEGYDVE
ncbi:ABC transporter permease [Halorientalis halophila]|uniref:ABC transporter permease n=1 Tax=Halorientalis halophila TaxID=3108499 RepID=UPI0030094CF3